MQIKPGQVKTKQVGADWEGSNSLNNTNYINAHLVGFGEAIYVFSTTERTLAKSVDGGKTLTDAGTGKYNGGYSDVEFNGECGFVLANNQYDSSNRFTISATTGEVIWGESYSLPASTYWRHISYGNGVWVALSSSEAIGAYFEESNTESTAFTQTTLPYTQAWYDLQFCGDKFIAAGRNGFAYSVDGKSWNQCTGSFPTVNGWGLAYANGVYIACSYNLTYFLRSSDGITWETGANTPDGGNCAYRIATDGDVFVAVYNGSKNAYYSYDGDNWEYAPVAVSNGGEIGARHGFIFHNGKFYAAMQNSSGAIIATTYNEYETQYRLMTPNGEDNTDNVADALGGVKIETGSYTGTETYGASNPCSITFSFEPKLVFLIGGTYISNGYFAQHFGAEDHNNSNKQVTVIPACLLTTSYTSGLGFSIGYTNVTNYARKSEDGKTIEWYETHGAAYQANSSSWEYHWLAIG